MAQILVSLDCKIPLLDSHPGPRFQNHGGQNTFVWHNNQRQVGAERPPARHRVVSGVTPSKSSRFGLRFWSRQIAKHVPWLDSHPGPRFQYHRGQNTFVAQQSKESGILVPDSDTMEDRTPLWHNNQRQVGAGHPLTRHQVVSGVAPSKRC